MIEETVGELACTFDIVQDGKSRGERAWFKVRARGVSLEVVVNSLGEVQAGLVSEDVRNEAFVDIVTRRGFVVEQETVEMGSSPVVDCGGVPVDLDEFGCLHRRMVVRELEIMTVSIDEGRAGGQEGNILGPNVFEGVGAEKVMDGHR